MLGGGKGPATPEGFLPGLMPAHFLMASEPGYDGWCYRWYGAFSLPGGLQYSGPGGGSEFLKEDTSLEAWLILGETRMGVHMCCMGSENIRVL